MFLRSLILSVSVLAAAAAQAAPATEAGAVKLTGVFQRYLGKTPGVVTVTPAGESYTLRVDAARLVAQLAQPGLALRSEPMQFSLTERGEGLWGVVQDGPLAIELELPGQITLSATAEKNSTSGLFDEALGTFREVQSQTKGMVLSQRRLTAAVEGQPAVPSVTRSEVSEATYRAQGVAGKDGGVDITSRMDMIGLKEVSTVSEPGMPAFELTLAAARYKVDGKIAGLRTHQTADLLAWAVAHASGPQVIADQEGLRRRLEALLPVFDQLQSQAEITGIKADTPLGRFTLDRVGVDATLNGVVEDGLLRQSISLMGFEAPAGVVPDWALPLVPEGLSLDLQAEGFVLAAPARLLIAGFDLTKPDPIDKNIGPTLLSAFLPGEGARITLAPGGVSGPDYNLGYEGSMVIGREGVPTGASTITVEGWDSVLAAVNAAPPEIRSEMGPAMLLIGGMARPAAGGSGLQWVIDAKTPGKILVNGVDVTAMGAAQ